MGRLKFASFDTVSTAKKIIVATEENVLAALNLKSGNYEILINLFLVILRISGSRDKSCNSFFE